MTLEYELDLVAIIGVDLERPIPLTICIIFENMKKILLFPFFVSLLCFFSFAYLYFKNKCVGDINVVGQSPKLGKTHAR